jgi:hypothetical protein
MYKKVTIFPEGVRLFKATIYRTVAKFREKEQALDIK